LDGVHALVGRLLYGTGMRITEALRLRIKDVDFDKLTLILRSGKGNEDRGAHASADTVRDLRALVCAGAITSSTRRFSAPSNAQ
jgi:integrase